MALKFYHIEVLLLILAMFFCNNTFADPVVEWNTFLGASVHDYGQSVATDGSGNVFIAGESSATWGSPIRPYSALGDVGVAKLNASGVLQWNTFLGTPNSNDINASTVTDSIGNVYVTGISHGSWGTPISPYPGSPTVFVAKLSSSGVLLWNTFLDGWIASEGDHSIGLDSGGNIYVTRCSYDWGTPIRPYSGPMDIFVAKLNNDGIFQWSTFLGSPDSDSNASLSIDAGGNVYVTGLSRATWGSPLNPHNGTGDVFVAKLSTSGFLQWNTFLGSSSSSGVSSIATDDNGYIYLTGYSGTSWGTPINPLSGFFRDGYVAKLNNNGIYQWHTYMGSSVTDYANDLTVDGNGNIYVTGESQVTWGSPITPHSGVGEGRMDGFVAKLNNEGIFQWNTFFGGTPNIEKPYITANNNGNIYAVGTTPGTWGTPINPYNAWRDIIVVAYSEDITPPTVGSTSPLNGASNIPVDITISATFSENIDALTIDTNTFSVDNGVTGTISYDLGTQTAAFSPTTNLDYDTTYTVTITTGVKDLALNPLSSNYNWSFTTEAASDTTPPVVNSTSPIDDATDVPVDSIISVTFSEGMDAASIDSNTLHLDNGATCSVSYDSGTRMATLTPSANLNENTTYIVTVTTGVRDVAGNPLQADFTCSFTTISATQSNGGSGGSGGCFINTMLK